MQFPFLAQIPIEIPAVFHSYTYQMAAGNYFANRMPQTVCRRVRTIDGASQCSASESNAGDIRANQCLWFVIGVARVPRAQHPGAKGRILGLQYTGFVKEPRRSLRF